MDELVYSDSGHWPVGPDGSGATLAKRHPEAASLPSVSWRSSVQDGGTPGAHNFPLGGDSPEVQAIEPGGDWRFEASGTDLGEAWRGVSYDDSAWGVGAAGFAATLVQNPSFEAETFKNNPGTISTNTPISAWQSLEDNSPGAEGFIGINTPGGIEPFSNNGLVPDGTNVAFIRGGPRALRQAVAGFVTGGRYTVRYRENGRAPTTPIAEVTLGGEVIVAAHPVSHIENAGQFTQPYHQTVSDIFTATASDHSLEIANLADIGQSLLLDDVRIDTITLHDTFSSGTSIDGRAVEFGLPGAAWESSSPTTTRIEAGVLTKSGSGNATVAVPINPANQTTLTLRARLNPGAGTTSKWSAIGFSNSDGTASLDTAGVLWVLLQEDGTVVLEANESGGTGVLGVSTPGSAPAYPFEQNGYNDIALIWDRGSNTASVILNGVTVFNSVGLDSNAGGDDASFAPPVNSVAVSFTTSGGALDDFALAEQSEPNTALPFQSGTTASYFRRSFEFSGDPAKATLVLSLAAADGALVWLNGQELLRANLPGGIIDAHTPALSTAGVDDSFVLPGSLLTPGLNTLAVEVHPAVGRTGSEFDSSLVIIAPLASPDDLPSIQLNEIAAAEDEGFFVELKNSGQSDIDLGGLRLGVAGSTDADLPLPATTLAAGGIFLFDQGFVGADEDRLFLETDSGALIDSARVKNRLRGRLDGAWQYPSSATPGAENQFTIPDTIVINEIMYHQAPTYEDLAEDIHYQEDTSEWIELYNRGSAAVDLSGWKLRDAIRYEFPPGTELGAGSFLVVGNDEFSGTLNNRGERIELRDANGNTADQLEYREGGRWPALADGGGASLELIDSEADNSIPESWAASDDSDDSTWQSFSYSGLGREPDGNNNPGFFNEFFIGLLDGGEILIDDISVVENPAGAALELVQNGGFEGDTIGAHPDKWRILGTHLESRVIADPDGGGKVLALRATGRLEHSYNLASTTFDNNRATNNNATYRISFRARWVSGSPQLNTRLYFNRLARTHIVSRGDAQHGTPGSANSVAVENAGPGFSSFSHAPPVPSPDDPIRISTVAADPDGVASAEIVYRNSSGDRPWSTVLMSADEAGEWSGFIPQLPARTVVEFYVRAEDGTGASATFPRGGASAAALLRIGDGSDLGRPVQTMRLIMDPDDAAFMHTAHHTPSNYRHRATVIYNDREIFYGCGVRLRGSSYGRRGGRVGWNVKFPDDQLFRGAHGTVAIDGGYSVPIGQGNGWVDVGPGVATNELVYNQMAHRAGGIPSTFDDIAYVEAPLADDSKLAQLKMARFGDIFLESELGSDQGERFKFELIYHPRRTIDGNPESLKDVYNAVLGVDISEMGSGREAYRHNYWVQNHADRDDYSRIADMGRAMDSSQSELKPATDAVLDIDNWMRVLAYQALTGTADTYNNGLPHNLLFYVRPDAGRKVMIFPWDVDHAFYYSSSDSIYGRASHRASDVIDIAQNNRTYCGHLLHLCNTGFDPSYIAQWVTHYNEIAELPIAGHYTQWITNRRNHVLARLNSEHPPVEFQITTNGGADFSVATPAAQLRGDGWIDVRDIVLARSGEALPVTWLDEDTWQVAVPLLSGENLIGLSATNHDGDVVGSDTITVTNTGSTEPASAGNLVISEIMYHPADPSATEIAAGFSDADEFEFIELRNIGSRTIELGGAAFSNGISHTFSGGQLLSGAATLLVRNLAAFEFRYGPGSAISGEYGDPDDPGGDGGSKLSNSGERLRLQDSGGSTIRDFSYDDSSPWPEEPDGGGQSLTLIQPAADPDHALATSWRASVAAGGSPGASDSSTLQGWLAANGLADPDGDPDGDGYSNFATYAMGIDLSGPGALPQVHVDRSGR
ncbi:MAG: lamin tail domain-containing protein, partial [Verrucomicrobiales bacterium]